MTYILPPALTYIVWNLFFWLYDRYGRMRLSKVSREILNKNNSLPESMRVPDLRKHLRAIDRLHEGVYEHFYTWDRYNSRYARNNRHLCYSQGPRGYAYDCEFVEYHQIEDAMNKLIKSHRTLENERMREGLFSGTTPAGRVLSALQSNNQAVNDVIDYLKGHTAD